MTSIHNGGQAFPAAAIGETHQINRHGMSLRDYFAAKAMQATCQDVNWANEMSTMEMAQYAYGIANAMPAAREA